MDLPQTTGSVICRCFTDSAIRPLIHHSSTRPALKTDSLPIQSTSYPLHLPSPFDTAMDRLSPEDNQSLSTQTHVDSASIMSGGSNLDEPSHDIQDQLRDMSLSSTTPASLQDVPDEILHQIAGILLKQPPEAWHQFRDSLLIKRHKLPEERRSVLALSSCCKALRRSVFQDWLMNQLTMEINHNDLRELEWLPAESRCCVR
jgi:hypothetical protein